MGCCWFSLRIYGQMHGLRLEYWFLYFSCLLRVESLFMGNWVSAQGNLKKSIWSRTFKVAKTSFEEYYIVKEIYLMLNGFKGRLWRFFAIYLPSLLVLKFCMCICDRWMFLLLKASYLTITDALFNQRLLYFLLRIWQACIYEFEGQSWEEIKCSI